MPYDRAVAPRTIAVQYCPPAYGTSHVPIKITGAGELRVTGEGLEAHGREVAGRGKGLLFLPLLLLVAVGGAILRTTYFPELVSDIVFYSIVGGLVGGVLFPLLRSPAKEGEATRLVIPWANVKKITHDPSAEALIVVVKKMKPKGGLYLRPVEGDLQALRESIEDSRRPSSPS